MLSMLNLPVKPASKCLRMKETDAELPRYNKHTIMIWFLKWLYPPDKLAS